MSHRQRLVGLGVGRIGERQGNVGADDDGEVTDLLGDCDGLPCEGELGRRSVGVRFCGGAGDESLGAGTGWLIRWDQAEGAGEGVSTVRVAVGDAIQDAQLEPDIGLPPRVFSGQPDGCPQVQIDRSVEPAGQLRCHRSLDEKPGMVRVAERGRVGDAVPQVERAAEMPLSFGGGTGGDLLPARRGGGRQSTLDVAGRRPVIGDPSEPIRVAGLEPGREAGRDGVRSPGTSSS